MPINSDREANLFGTIRFQDLATIAWSSQEVEDGKDAIQTRKPDGLILLSQKYAGAVR
jgi:hypothetical protein